MNTPGVPPVPDQPVLSLAAWIRFGKERQIKGPQPANETLALVFRFRLNLAYGEGALGTSHYFLDVYQLPNHQYNDPLVVTKVI